MSRGEGSRLDKRVADTEQSMTVDERLADVFDRGQREGLDALTLVERDLWHIQDFIIEYENGGLGGYFYNRLPDLGGILVTARAMRARKLVELATFLDEATALFTAYVDPDPPSTWDDVCRKYDPSGRLEELDKLIGVLNRYGLGNVSKS